MRSVLECVLEHAAQRPDHDVVRLVSHRVPSARRTYAEIAAGAERAAGFLAAKGIGKGDPVALIGSHHVDLYTSWLGALWVGAVPTVLAEPSVRIDKGFYWSRLAKLLERNQVETILLEPGIDVTGSAAGSLRSFTYEEVAAGGHPTPSQVVAEPEALIALQHSSGTTGLQKGVMLTHAMMMRHCAAQNARTGLSASDTTANWLPLFHDLGLICSFIQPMITGGTMVWLSPFEWVATPSILLSAITEHRATIMWLPNFAFAFMAQGVSDPPEAFDLSSMRSIYSGGEAVSESAMEAFYHRFKGSGLKHEALHVGYGMAEAVGGIAHSSAEHPARFFRVDKRVWAEDHRAEPPADPLAGAAVHLSCGPPLDGCEIRVVDAEGHPLPPRHAGRILLRSTYLFTGYYRRDDLNGDLFDAEGFLDTGDVGYLDEDGHVYVTGRLKELTKVGGRTVYPQDVEDVLNTIPGVHPGRAVCFGVSLAARGTEGLVILAESDLPEAEWPALASRVRLAVVKAADVDVLDMRIVARNSLRKSTAGKLARDGNREWYLDAKFGPLPPAVAAAPRAPAA